MLVTKNQVIASVAGVIVVAIVVGAVLVYSARVSSRGRIVAAPGIEVFADAACTEAVVDIDWGTLQPGSSSVVGLWIKNTGGCGVSLGLSGENWSPAAVGVLGWSYDGSVLAVGGVVGVDVVLEVFESAGGGVFSVDVVVSASAVE